jgi:tetratricopeptide (TPR) repeat protein
MARAQYTDALKYLDASQALAPANWSGNATRGLALMRLGQTARAETAFRQALDADPCNYGAQYFLGDLYGAQQQHQKALEAYRKAAALEPFNGLPWLSIAREQSLLGNSAEREAAWRKALPLLEEAMREQPADASFPFLVGITNFLLKQYEAAVTAFRKQVELTPTDGDGHYYLGASLAALGRHAEAVPELELALKAYPDDSVTMLDLAEAYQKTQRILEALALYQKIVAVDKQNIAAWLGIANLAAANANWTESAGAWEALVALDPKDADARASLAYAYMQLKRYGAAAREYRTAAESVPSNLRHRAGEAWALAMDGQADAALSIAREVLAKATKGDLAEALAHFASGLALKAQGQKTEAILAFQAAVQSSPTKEVRELAEAELAQLRQ